MGSLHKNIYLMLELHKAPFLVLHSSYYTLKALLMMLSVILVSILMILLCILNVMKHLMWQFELASALEANLQDTVDWGKNWLVNFNASFI